MNEEEEIEVLTLEEVPQNKNGKDPKKKKGKGIFVVFLILIVVGGLVFAYFEFAPKKEGKEEKIKTEKKEVKSEYRLESNQLENFDLAFLKLENADKNIIYSPLSIKYALEMLGEGASGDSKAQLDAVIGAYQAKKYTNSSAMSFANAMFIKNTYQDKMKEEYKNILVTKYNADLVFDSFQTPDVENAWVKEKTLGLIDHLFDDIKDNNFILANVLAIDMDWKHKIQYSSSQSSTPNPKTIYNVHYSHEKYQEGISPLDDESNYLSLSFNDKKMDAKAVEIGASINNYDIISALGEDAIRSTITKEYTEYVNSGEGCVDTTLTIPQYVDKFIEELKSNYHQLDTSTDFMIYYDDNVKAFAKDLKEYDGTTLQYVGIMPQQQDINTYINKMDKNSINQILKNLKTIENKSFEEGKVYKITGYIPLFGYENEIDLKKDLNSLGIHDVLEEGKADLSNMITEKGSYIDKISHKANIEFSNEGIKASAATQGGGLGAAMCGFEHLYEVPVKTINMTFNKPYIFLIRDKKTEEVWFVGKVYEPIEKPCEEISREYNCVE